MFLCELRGYLPSLVFSSPCVSVLSVVPFSSLFSLSFRGSLFSSLFSVSFRVLSSILFPLLRVHPCLLSSIFSVCLRVSPCVSVVPFSSLFSVSFRVLSSILFSLLLFLVCPRRRPQLTPAPAQRGSRSASHPIRVHSFLETTWIQVGKGPYPTCRAPRSQAAYVHLSQQLI